jgi:hypothetical protein
MLEKIIFKPITLSSMKDIWYYLLEEHGRTTDFSYGGVYMWVEIFKYEYCVFNDTLFIKGVLEDNRQIPAFSLPIGKMTISDSVAELRKYCENCGIALEFSAIPEYAIPEFKALSPKAITKLNHWGDYIYDAESLATLRGKKMSKKRNHVNRFLVEHPDFKFKTIRDCNIKDVLNFLIEIKNSENISEMAEIEMSMSYNLIKEIERHGNMFESGVLIVDDKICAVTVGDIKDDTLFVHIEKGKKDIVGSYEMINKSFAASMLTKYPNIKYINREDDAGDIGLKQAKESYQPLEVLSKYNILM